MSRKQQIGVFLFFVVCFVTIGFSRDTIFYNINAELEFRTGYPHNYTNPFFIDFFFNKSITDLINLKWFMTILTMLLYYEVSFAALVVFKKLSLTVYLTYIFGGLVILSAFFFGVGYITEEVIPGYRISRIFMGFLQSPLPIMILVPAQFLQKVNR